jgi:ubiquinol-cytochrome c reductase cytochrome c1 subunit
MTNMGFIKKIIGGVTLGVALMAGAHASGGGAPWDKVPNRQSDMAALQNGAKLFVNYCLNCHSASFMRYTRLTDLGLTQQQIKDNLLVTDSKIGETMNASIDARQAKDWFGNTPPDLTVISRSRAGSQGSGGDYLYTYLRGFYRDESKATGWNNLAFPNVAMPHAMWELQGQRHAVFEEVERHGEKTHVFKRWEQITPGTLKPAQFDDQIADLVNYMQWMAEPAQAKRLHLGGWVLLFLVVLIFSTYQLNKAYWKDIK